MSAEDDIALLKEVSAGLEQDSRDEGLSEHHRRFLGAVAGAFKIEAYRLAMWPAYFVQPHILDAARAYLGDDT